MSLIEKIKDRAAKAGAEVQSSIIEELANFTETPKVSVEIFEKRIAICESCNNFNANTRRCELCFCTMDIKASLEINPITKKNIICSLKNNPKW